MFYLKLPKKPRALKKSALGKSLLYGKACCYRNTLLLFILSQHLLAVHYVEAALKLVEYAALQVIAC